MTFGCLIQAGRLVQERPLWAMIASGALITSMVNV